MSSKRETGQQIEDIAARYLQRRGVRITARNVYSRGGELDLVGLDGDTVVFFEVRYRGRGSLVSAEESVGYHKQQRVLRAANYYLHRHGLWNAQARIDVVAVSPGGLKRFKIHWIKNAIQSSA